MESGKQFEKTGNPRQNYTLMAGVTVCFILFVILIGAMNRGNGDKDPINTDSVVTTSRAETEALSACNNNGYLFEGEKVCECFNKNCFTGDKCQTYLGDDMCEIDVDGGSPEIFTEYWVKHPMRSTVSMSHRIGYNPVKVDERLKNAIIRIHKHVNNSATDGMHLVFSSGSTSLISIAAMARRDKSLAGTCKLSATSPAPGGYQCAQTSIWAPKPYYSGYNLSLYDSIRFVGELSKEQAQLTPDLIEFVTTPSNPHGEMRTRRISGGTAVWDLAYYWPTYSAMSGPQPLEDRDISIFTLSKLTGHASARVGWAWVKDEATARTMQSMACPIGCPLQAQVFATEAINHILDTNGQIFKWGHEQLEARWQRLRAVFAKTSSFSIKSHIHAAADAYSGASSYRQTPPYLWFE
jgi:hypothetical protein